MARFATGAEGATHLQHFRADSIVRDCEHLRKSLLGDGKWFTLGQSYGGFLTLTYLSLAPEGLAGCYVTGGLAGLDATADEVYHRTYPRVAARTALYYGRYSQDRAAVGRIADATSAGQVLLPDGDRLTTERLQTLGMDFGMAPGFENVHRSDPAATSRWADRACGRNGDADGAGGMNRGGTEIVTVQGPFTFRKRGGRRVMVMPEGTEPERPQVDNTLAKALARAFRWKKMLESGKFNTINDVAVREKIQPSYLTRILRLTLLAPEFVEEIVEGRQGPGVTLTALMERVPEEWSKQYFTD